MAGFFVAATILIYDALLSHTVAGPISMAACRAANVLLGASLCISAIGFIPVRAFAAAALVGLYTSGISLLARQEARPRFWRVTVSGLPFVLALAGTGVLTCLLPIEENDRWGSAWTVLVMLWIITYYAGTRIWMTRPSIIGAVKRSILFLPVLDGFLVARFYDWRAGLLVAALALPCWLLSRWFRMT